MFKLLINLWTKINLILSLTLIDKNYVLALTLTKTLF
jgi:hypothetical protein